MREKIQQQSFSYLNLSGRNFSGMDILECDFSRSDCSGADFSDSVLFGSDFSNSKLSGAIVSLNCGTFKGVKFDRKQVEYFIYLLSLSDIPEDIKDRLIEIIGEKKKQQLESAFGQ